MGEFSTIKLRVRRFGEDFEASRKWVFAGLGREYRREGMLGKRKRSHFFFLDEFETEITKKKRKKEKIR